LSFGAKMTGTGRSQIGDETGATGTITIQKN